MSAEKNIVTSDNASDIEVENSTPQITRHITISVRELVEFLMRSGDIDNRHGSVASASAMAEGTRIHKKIQKEGGKQYQAEVALRHTVELPDYSIVIDGRADGIFEDSETGDVVIDEIKGVYRDVTLMDAPVDVHLAQAKCYAYIYSLQQDLSSIDVQMTYCDLDTEVVQRFRSSYSYDDISNWFKKLIEDFVKWAEYDINHIIERDESIKALNFPFEYREGQKKLCSDVYISILRKKNLFIEAPTGTGKTINAIFPAVKSMAEGLSRKLFYVTAKTVTASVALNTMRLIASRGCLASAVQLVAKEKMCVLDAVNCNPDDCPRAKGHFDRINEALYDILTHEQVYTRELISQYAEKHNVCPFEFALDISSFSDVIIGDYNYIFDPRVKLKRFFAGGTKGDYVFMVDEAHNLVDRAREMYSATISKEDVLACKRHVTKYSKRATNALTKLNTVMLAYKKVANGLDVLDEADDFYSALCRASDALHSLLEKRFPIPERDEIAQFYFAAMNFIEFYERMDDKYILYSLLDENGFMIKIFCADPSTRLQECIDSGRSAIFFSATLLPIDYYKKLISTCEDNYAVYATSIFDPKQRLLLIANDVTSKYTARTLSMYERIADYIEIIASGKCGNYMAFFPSYSFMEDVMMVWESRMHSGMRTIMQSQGMRESERDEFMSAFESNPDETLIGFCVLGGIFSEGIDLTEDRLIGAIIVGTGLGGIDQENELLKDFFDQTGKNGFDYVYRYPGMNRVEQAAGRVIRTVNDRGIIALLDQRFLQASSKSLFPREWADYEVTDITKVDRLVRDFWDCF